MDPYVGEIRIFCGNYAPRDWAFCNGQLLNIYEYQTLFTVIGTTYGGDGRTTFGLPDLQGRAPMHQGVGAGLTPRQINDEGGAPTITLNILQLPAHTHVPQGSTIDSEGVADPTNAIWGSQVSFASPDVYAANGQPTLMNPLALAPTGFSQPHNNMQPYLGLNFIIALEGVFPSKSD